MSRFNPRQLVRGHWNSLSTDGDDATSAMPDVASRVIFAVVPAGCVIASYVWHWKIGAPTALLSGVALLAGGLLGAFGQLATMRTKMTERRLFEGDAEATDRNMIDETVAHLLLAALLCGVDAVLIIIGLNTAKNPATLTGLWADAVIGVSAYVALLFLVSVPRLYSAYVQYNEVSPHLLRSRSRRR